MKVETASILPNGAIRVNLTVDVEVINGEATCLTNRIEVRSNHLLNYDLRRAVIRLATEALHEHQRRLIMERTARALIAVEHATADTVLISITEEDDRDRPLSRKELSFELRADGVVICRNDLGVIPQIVARARDIAHQHFSK